MKKLVLVVVFVAALGALAAYLVSQADKPSDSSAGKTEVEADGTQPDGLRDATPEEKKKRQRSAAEEAAPPVRGTLFVSGVVKTPDGKPVAGAVVEAFAVPAGEDVPDEERVGRPILHKLFGKAQGDRLWDKTKAMRDQRGNPDVDKALKAMPDAMAAGMDLLSDEAGMDAIMSVMSVARDAVIGDDAPWTKVGSAATAGDGAFKIEALGPGRVELRARATGYVKSKKRANAGDKDVAMQLDRGARLAGIVTCEKEPVVGASVVIKGDKTTSGAGGRFAFDAAHVPSEMVIVSAPDCVGQGRMIGLALDYAAPDVTIELEPAGSIAGHVSSVTGGFVAGARVTVTGAGGIMELMGMAMSMGQGQMKFDMPATPGVTDGAGAFEIHGAKTGQVKIRVEADGYLAATVTVEVKKGQTSAVEALLVQESVFSGVVKDEKGAPIAEAKVRVEAPARDPMVGMIASMMAGGTWKSAYTNDKGEFEVHALAEGDHKVKIEAAKFLTQEDRVSLPARGAVTKVFTMKPGFSVSGTVAGPDGKPIAGAKISASGAGGGMGGMAAMFGGMKSKDPVATSDAEGKWTADGLPQGPYEVSATADGFIEASVSDVAAGKTDVALTLGLAAVVKGRVIAAATMQPVAKARVAYRAVHEADADAPAPRAGRRGGRNPLAAMMGGGGSVTCGEDGMFEIKGLEPGEYDLTGSMKGFADSEAVKVRTSAGQTFEGADIQLPAGVAVAGRVVETSTGGAVAGALVWASSGGNPFAAMMGGDASGGDVAPPDAVSARTDSGGHFVLDGLSPGATTIEVRAPDHAPTSSHGVAVPSTEVTLMIGAGGTVEGKVTTEDGANVAGAQIMVGRGMMGGSSARTDAKGEYRVEHLTPGTYQIKLVDTKNLMAAFMPGKDSVVVKEGQTVRHDFKKKGGSGRQFGGAALRDGKPLANAAVFLVGGDSGFKMATTDEKGRYSFEGLEAGEYTVALALNPMGGGSVSKKVTVGSGGKIDDVPLELSSAKIEGDVIDVETGKGVATARITLTDPGTKFSSSSDLMSGMRGQGVTDERGHFVITDVANTTFTVRVSATDYVTATLDGVQAGASDLKVSLHRGVEFLVTVKNAAGEAVPGASVKSTDSSGRENLAIDMTMSSFTRGDGVAHLRLAQGRYGLDVTADNYLPAHADVDTLAGPATIVLQAGATLSVSVVDASGSAVAGAKVVVKDSAGKEIARGISMSGFMGDSDVTDSNGRFTRGGLPGGPVIVVVTAPGHEMTAVDAVLESGKPKGVDVVLK